MLATVEHAKVYGRLTAAKSAGILPREDKVTQKDNGLVLAELTDGATNLKYQGP